MLPLIRVVDVSGSEEDCEEMLRSRCLCVQAGRLGRGCSKLGGGCVGPCVRWICLRVYCSVVCNCAALGVGCDAEKGVLSSKQLKERQMDGDKEEETKASGSKSKSRSKNKNKCAAGALRSGVLQPRQRLVGGERAGLARTADAMAVRVSSRLVSTATYQCENITTRSAKPLATQSDPAGLLPPA